MEICNYKALERIIDKGFLSPLNQLRKVCKQPWCDFGSDFPHGKPHPVSTCAYDSYDKSDMEYEQPAKVQH